MKTGTCDRCKANDTYLWPMARPRGDDMEILEMLCGKCFSIQFGFNPQDHFGSSPVAPSLKELQNQGAATERTTPWMPAPTGGRIVVPQSRVVGDSDLNPGQGTPAGGQGTTYRSGQFALGGSLDINSGPRRGIPRGRRE